mmetsp:Transcript_23984/g.51148  ORF Transcript_23984/g.51148 Transcript_23984/m.51148 type:complete len:253 (+) Transcript_23984:1339-2097(+)
MAESLRAEGKCEHCMFQVKYCLCKSLAGLRTKAELPVHFVVCMHIKERSRASNTGKLLEHLLPRAEVLVQDVPIDMQRLQELVRQSGDRAFVLYPSEDSITASELLEAARNSAKANEKCDDNERQRERPWLPIIIDGTWRQAKRMHKDLEGLPHVRLSNVRGNSQFHWRRQTEEGRISTVEAAAFLLEELKCELEANTLRRGLGLLNRALECQCHYDGFATGPPPPEPSARKRAAQKHRLPKRPPGLRSSDL